MFGFALGIVDDMELCLVKELWMILYLHRESRVVFWLMFAIRESLSL